MKDKVVAIGLWQIPDSEISDSLINTTPVRVYIVLF